MGLENLVLAVKCNLYTYLFTYFLHSVYCIVQYSLVSSFTDKIEFAHPKRAHIFSLVVNWLVPIYVSTKLLLIQIKLGYQGLQLADRKLHFFGKENSLTFSSQNNEAKLPDLKKGEGQPVQNLDTLLDQKSTSGIQFKLQIKTLFTLLEDLILKQIHRNYQNIVKSICMYFLKRNKNLNKKLILKKDANLNKKSSIFICCYLVSSKNVGRVFQYMYHGYNLISKFVQELQKKCQWSKSVISIGIPKLHFKFQMISIVQLHCTLHSCQIARAATVDWIGAFLKCKPSYLMRGIKSVRRKMMIAWIYPKIAKSAAVILVEEVASLTKETRQCQKCLLSTNKIQ